MQGGHLATGAVGLAFEDTLTHVGPIVEDGPQGALDPTIFWHCEDLVQEWLRVICSLHSHKATVAAVGVVHEEVIHLAQFLLLEKIIYLVDFVFHQGRPPTDSERSSALSIPIEMPHIVPAGYLEWTEDMLVFWGETSKK